MWFILIMGRVFAHRVALEGHKLGEIWEDEGLRFKAVFDLTRVPVLHIRYNLQESYMTDDDSKHSLDDGFLVSNVDEVISCKQVDEYKDVDDSDSCVQLGPSPRRAFLTLHKL